MHELLFFMIGFLLGGVIGVPYADQPNQPHRKQPKGGQG